MTGMGIGSGGGHRASRRTRSAAASDPLKIKQTAVCQSLNCQRMAAGGPKLIWRRRWPVSRCQAAWRHIPAPAGIPIPPTVRLSARTGSRPRVRRTVRRGQALRVGRAVAPGRRRRVSSRPMPGRPGFRRQASLVAMPVTRRMARLPIRTAAPAGQKETLHDQAVLPAGMGKRSPVRTIQPLRASRKALTASHAVRSLRPVRVTARRQRRVTGAGSHRLRTGGLQPPTPNRSGGQTSVVKIRKPQTARLPPEGSVMPLTDRLGSMPGVSQMRRRRQTVTGHPAPAMTGRRSRSSLPDGRPVRQASPSARWRGMTVARFTSMPSRRMSAGAVCVAGPRRHLQRWRTGL